METAVQAATESQEGQKKPPGGGDWFEGVVVVTLMADDWAGYRCCQELQVDFAQRQHRHLHCLREDIQKPRRGGSGYPSLG